MTETLPARMKAVVLTGHGGPETLEFHADWPRPEPGPGQVLMRVLACGLNNTDVNTRTGWYARAVTGATGSGVNEGIDEAASTWGGAGVSFPRIQGADIAGRVVAAGPDADAALIGRRVMVETWLRDWNDPANRDRCGYLGSEADGGFAEYCALDARQVHPIDCALSDAELATFATSWVTAENMLNRAGVGAGDTVLITGASGGVGSALIQLANRRGARTVALAGASKIEAVRALGPTAVLDRRVAEGGDLGGDLAGDLGGDLAGALEGAIGVRAVSVVADVVGGPAFQPLIEVLE
ncbi:MAG: alcohol dehydrogenase catalytic domain-containing protein, partial [Pseudomonadota bacterium]